MEWFTVREVMIPNNSFERRSPYRGIVAWAVVLWLITVLALTTLFVLLVTLTWKTRGADVPSARNPSENGRPIQVRDDGYVSSQTCRSCHPDQYATWHASYHRTMTQVARPDTVIAPFDNVQLTGNGRSYHLRTHEDEFWLEIEERREPTEADLYEPSGQAQSVATNQGTVPRLHKPIVMCTGRHHQQIYWYSTGDSRKVDYLPFIYLTETRQWVPRNSAFLRPPRQPLSEQPGLWNMSCIRCHTTHGRPRTDEHESMDTFVAEFGIACEACHGPAEQHVLYNRDPRHRYRSRLTEGPDSTIVDPSKLPHDLSSHVCAQCHSVNQFYSETDEQSWAASGYRYRPGDDLDDTRMVVKYSENPSHPRLQGVLHYYPQYMDDFFWSDGMIRVSGREFNGLQESACFQRGEMSCLSCHAMHQPADDERSISDWANDQLIPNMDGDEACLQCHDAYRHDVERHTHHAPESSGSRCYNCHMPYTTYGLLKAIRSHQVDSPAVNTSLETGRPNACNLCHLDKTLAWSAGHLSQWAGQNIPWLTEDERSIAASLLWLIRGDAGQRALMAWSMGWEPARQASGATWPAPFLAQLLDDPYDAVRYIAYRSLRSLPGYEDFSYNFVGTTSHRAEARMHAVEMWRRTSDDKQRKTGAKILIDGDGTLDRQILNRLLRQRDDRRVNLNE